MIVYKMTNKITGLSYVGATTRELKARLWDHASSWKRGKTTLIAMAIRDYGMGAFKVEVLCRVTSGSFDDLMNEEIKAIREHGTLEPHGYNRSSGGIGTPDCRHLESTRLKIGEKSKGRIPSMETRAKMSAAHKGKPCTWNEGPRNVPAWNKGIKATPEHRRKLSESRTGEKNWKAEAIEFKGVVYSSISDAHRATGYSRMQIRYRLAKGDAARYLKTKGEK